MKKFSISKGNNYISFLINKYKFIVGDNHLEKLKVIRLFDELASKIGDSEYSKEFDTIIKFKIDESEVNVKKINIFKIDSEFSLSKSFKLQSSSIVLKSLVSKLSSIEYIDTYETINQLIESICIQFNETNNIKIKFDSFNELQLIKLIHPYIVLDGLMINEYDLSLHEFILLQLEIIKEIVEKNELINIVVINYPVIYEAILNKIKEIKNCYFIFVSEKVLDNYEISNYYLTNKLNLDLSNEEEIYDIVCCRILNNSNLMEGKKYMEKLIKNNIYSINLHKNK